MDCFLQETLVSSVRHLAQVDERDVEDVETVVIDRALEIEAKEEEISSRIAAEIEARQIDQWSECSILDRLNEVVGQVQILQPT